MGLWGFELNVGQLREGVIAHGRLVGMSLYITEWGVSYVLYGKETGLRLTRVDVKLKGASIKRENVELHEPLPGYSNYYLPHCPEGILSVPSYRRVVIRDVYPGVDWVWRVEKGVLHQEFVLRRPDLAELIKMEVKGADVDLEGGKLRLSTPLGYLEEGEVLLLSESGKALGTADYRLEGNVVGFSLEGLKHSGRVIVDPPLVWSTYYGGGGQDLPISDDGSMNVAIDGSRNVVVAGITLSNDFPTYDPGGGAYYDGTYNGNRDIVIVKFTNTGQRVWATYYGGSSTDGREPVVGVDASGNVFLASRTASSDIPTHNPGGGAYYDGTHNGDYDLVIAKFSPSGQMLWATFYGGSGRDLARALAVGPTGELYIAGSTSSSDFPTYDPGGGAYYDGAHNGGYDAFLLKFTNTGQRLWATLYGGNSDESVNGLAVDASGNTFAIGSTRSGNFPTYNPGGGAYYDGSFNGGTGDAFLLKFSPSGQRLWATYFGGSSYDVGQSITVDPSGNVFASGRTSSSNFPTYNPGGGAYYDGTLGGSRDVFVAKFSNTGQRLWTTYYGGSGVEHIAVITSDADGNVYITGSTSSSDLPTYDPADGSYYDGSYNGNGDAFVLKFSNSGVRKWATYLGGTGPDDGRGIAAAGPEDCILYVVGYTESPNFPTVNPGGSAYYDNSYNGSGDIYVSRFGNCPLGAEGELSTDEFSQDWVSDVRVFRGGLRLLGYGEYAVYNAAGRKVRGGVLSGEVMLGVKGGVYTVRLGKRTFRVIVR